MFEPVNQKSRSRRVRLMIVVGFLALSVSACTSTQRPSEATGGATANSEVTTPLDYCPNLPEVDTEDELPVGYQRDYELERGVVCIPVEEVQKRLAEEKRVHQEAVAKATALVLESRSASDATSSDKMLGAVAYFCNHPGNQDAEIAARLVYGENNTLVPPLSSQDLAEAGFDRIAALVCGVTGDDPSRNVPVEAPPEPGVNF